MQLCEEYLKRHSLNFPFVRHTKSGCLFLRDPAPKVRWAVVKMTWYKDTSHPGKYKVELCKPVHNGCSYGPSANSRLFLESFEDTHGRHLLDWTGTWNLYEDYMQLLTSCLKGKPIMCRQEVAVSAWEMFLVSHDRWLTSYVHPDSIFPIIDSDLGIEKRHAHLQQMLRHFSIYHEDVYDFWNTHVANLTHSYSYWLGEMINRNRNADEETDSSQKSKLRESLDSVMFASGVLDPH